MQPMAAHGGEQLPTPEARAQFRLEALHVHACIQGGEYTGQEIVHRALQQQLPSVGRGQPDPAILNQGVG